MLPPMAVAPLVIGLLAFALLVIIVAKLWNGGAGTEEIGRLRAELEAARKELGQIGAELSETRSAKNELVGHNKQLFVQQKELEAEYRATSKRLAAYEAAERDREEKLTQKIEKMEAAQRALAEERARVTREDDERRTRAEEERDRLWAEHEANVIGTLTNLCKLPQIGFTAYSNTHLPDGFDGSLKPDFLIEFLGQYVIFDAKISKRDNLQIYISDAVKKTAEKVRKNSKIYPYVFLVVPTQAIPELKATIYPKDELTFYVVSPEALAPILACLKRITAYDLAESIDPQKRENIINALAETDFQLRLRNSAEIILTQMGVSTLQKIESLDPELAQEVQRKREEKMKAIPQIVGAALKKMVGSTVAQEEEVRRLVAPRASAKAGELSAAKEALLRAL